jgi:hypothetical protein
MTLNCRDYYTLKTLVFKIALVLRKSKLCMEKPVITQKFVLKITQICFAATQNFPTQARFQHKSDFERQRRVTDG